MEREKGFREGLGKFEKNIVDVVYCDSRYDKSYELTMELVSYTHLDVYKRQEWELTAHYFATGQLKFDPGFIYKKIPMSQAQEAFQLFKTPGLVKGKRCV